MSTDTASEFDELEEKLMDLGLPLDVLLPLFKEREREAVAKELEKLRTLIDTPPIDTANPPSKLSVVKSWLTDRIEHYTGKGKK